MNGKHFIYVAIAASSVIVSEANAQTFLQRLTEQLGQPAAPPAVRESLPPPREVLPTNGVSRASLGIRVGPITADVQRDQRLVVRRGAVITAIEQGSAADRAGLPLGGVIVAFDGRRIDTPDDLVEAVRAARPGQDVELTYYDREKLARKKVHLAAVSAPGALVPYDSDAQLNIPPPLPTPPPQAAPQASSNLERQLGAGGSRPLLGRIGRAIDNFAEPAQAIAPAEPTVTNRVDLGSEVLDLRQQVAELAQEVSALREQIAALEEKLSDKK